MALQGMEDLKKLADELHEMASAKRKPSKFFLPHIFLVNEPGAGSTYFIRLLAYLLNELGLFEFSGLRRWLEFTLHDEADCDRLFAYLQDASGFSNLWSGVLALDIAHFDGNNEILMRVTKKLKEKCLLVFCVRPDSPHLREAFYTLTSAAPFELMECLLPATPDMVAYMMEQLTKFGYKVLDEAKDLLCSYVSTLRRKPEFHGFITLSAAAWELAHQSNSLSEISPAEVQAFMDREENSEKRLESHSHRKIGFH